MSRTPLRRSLSFLIAAVAMAGIAPARAADAPPYWASLHVAAHKGDAATDVNMHVGPGRDYRINWVYHRQNLPVKVLREMAGWRLIEDQDNARGWVLAIFVSHARTAVVIGDGAAESHAAPDPASRLAWRLDPGVVGQLGDCASDWCAFNVDGRAGYVEQARLWGAGNP